LIEATEQFAEEVVTAAFQRGATDNLQWLQPLQEKSLELLKNVTPTANMPVEDKKAHVHWALDMLKDNWFESLVSERARILEEAHSRLRKAVRTTPLKVVPHTPPDILGCYVLVPAEGGK
jgi:hypothetical protein